MMECRMDHRGTNYLALVSRAVGRGQTRASNLTGEKAMFSRQHEKMRMDAQTASALRDLFIPCLTSSLQKLQCGYASTLGVSIGECHERRSQALSGLIALLCNAWELTSTWKERKPCKASRILGLLLRCTTIGFWIYTDPTNQECLQQQHLPVFPRETHVITNFLVPIEGCSQKQKPKHVRSRYTEVSPPTFRFD